eukprot:3796996-Rhodomonas_salina.1
MRKSVKVRKHGPKQASWNEDTCEGGMPKPADGNCWAPAYEAYLPAAAAAAAAAPAAAAPAAAPAAPAVAVHAAAAPAAAVPAATAAPAAAA